MRCAFVALSRLVCCGMLLGCRAVCGSVPSSPYFTVTTEVVTDRVEAFAQVQPISLVQVKSPAIGILSGLRVMPGAAVAKGQPLATLTGPEVDAARIRAKAALGSAEARLVAARKTLSVLQSQLKSHLSTRQQVAQAQADLADATGALGAAKAGVELVKLAASIPAPVSGTVLSLGAGEGQRLGAGDTPEIGAVAAPL